MVPKADSGTFLLLFLLVLSITEPLRPGRGGGGTEGGREGGGGGGAGGAGPPSSACGRVAGPEPCGRGGRRGSPRGGRASGGPGREPPAGAGGRPGSPPVSGVPGRSAPGGCGGEPGSFSSRRGRVAVAQSRSRARGMVRAQPAASLPLLCTFKKRWDLADLGGGGGEGRSPVPAAWVLRGL